MTTTHAPVLVQDIAFEGVAQEAYEELVSGAPEVWAYPADVRENIPYSPLGLFDALLYARLCYQGVNPEKSPKVVCAVPYASTVAGSEQTRDVTVAVPYDPADHQGREVSQTTFDLVSLLAPLRVKKKVPPGFVPVSIVIGLPSVVERLGSQHTEVTASVTVAKASAPGLGWVFSRPES